MIESVKSYIKQHQLCNPKSPILLACSGGGDSMVLVDILQKLDFPIGIAHCNFQLRGKESDEEHEFVKQYCLTKEIPFYDIKFDTTSYSKAHHLSIQLAARELRYNWLEEIRIKNHYHFIATAHHLNDNAETILLNFIKGTGVRGLKGIPYKNDKIIRPLLANSKADILEYLKTYNIAYRNDSSNDSIKYDRNYLRHEVIPQIEQINPSFIANMEAFSEQMDAQKDLLEEIVTIYKKKVMVIHDHYTEIKFGLIKAHSAGKTLLYEILKSYHFNSNQILEIWNALFKSQSGVTFLSATHRLIKDRNSLFIEEIGQDKSHLNCYEKIPNQILFNGHKIKVDIVPIAKINQSGAARFAYFDADKISMPLKIRFPKTGDYFYPFGMTKVNSDKVGKKKLSKFFKDIKLSQLQKEITPLLFSNQHLIWVVGHRIDDRFKVTEETKRVLKMVVIK